MIRRLCSPVSRRTCYALIAANLLLRVLLATLPGYVSDVDSYKRWGLGAARGGLAAAYENTRVDYPPLFLYVLSGVCKIYLLVDPDASPDNLPDATLLTFLVKMPHLAADLLLAALLFSVVSTLGSWGPIRAGPGHGRTAALLYLWNPAVLFGSAYWGQPDGLHSALAFGAIAALAVRRCGSAGVLLSLGGLMKPLAAPLVPLLAVAAAASRGLRGFTAAGLGGLLAAVVVFLPFVVTGRIGPVLQRVLLDVEAMPFTSVNGHNLWWFLGSWRDANAAWLGPITPKVFGLTLFLALYAALLVRAVPWLRDSTTGSGEYVARLYLTAAAVTTSFFFLSTHMHENHMFLAVPFLLAVAGRSRELCILAILASLAVFFNEALHDLSLPHLLPMLGRPSPVIDPHLGTPYSWVQIVGSFLNATLVAGVFAATFRAAWRIADEPAES